MPKETRRDAISLRIRASNEDGGLVYPLRDQQKRFPNHKCSTVRRCEGVKAAKSLPILLHCSGMFLAPPDAHEGTEMMKRCLFISLVVLFANTSYAQGPDKSSRPIVKYPLEFAVSPPVRDLPPGLEKKEDGEKERPLHRPFLRSGNVPDPAVQTSTPTLASAQGINQWEGLGVGYPGFTLTALPPDPNMAVGPNHIVQWVNNAFVVFDKQGNEILAPVDDGTFWGGLAGTCNQLGGFSDPIVQYDRMADRGIVGEVALPLLPGPLGQFAQCFAVSTTSDPTGSYYMWAYGFGTDIPDYPKISVWPDVYFLTLNIFSHMSG